jgi:cellulose synthase/poly-beta-1,6-N-acetylglucosamine synthase-like glycosyltransferase
VTSRIGTWFLLLAAAWLGYVYVIYPRLLTLAARLRRRPVRRADVEPFVCLVISAFNEERCIAAKLDNALALDYPEGRIEIHVSSDGSTDRTNEIAAGYAERHARVRLHAYPVNRGKTETLKHTVQSLPGHADIVVFSDANSMYQPSAIRMLGRNFADPAVGCVCGELRYRAVAGEGSYRSWENRLRLAQSDLGVPPSAEGSIFAIRRALMPDIPSTVMEDLVIPYLIAERGYRVVWEPEAISVEEFTLSWDAQMRRRRRIVNRAIRALRYIPFAWNPFRSGWVAFHFVSHRIMRWLAPLLIFPAWVVALLLGLADRALWPVSAVALAALAWYVVTRVLIARRVKLPRLLLLPSEFVMANTAILSGVVSAVVGRRVERWVPAR